MRPSEIVDRLLSRLGARRQALHLSYEITWLCNLSCSYCQRRTPYRREMTRRQILEALDGFLTLGLRHAHLDGGEPLLHTHIDEVVDRLARRGVTLSLHTNGILVPRKLETVRRLSGLVVSLDGTRVCHDAARGAGSHDKAVEGARAAREAGVRVEFRCTVGRHNADCLESLLVQAQGIGIPVVFHAAAGGASAHPSKGTPRCELDSRALRAAFARLEDLKRLGLPVGNDWPSLWRLRSCSQEMRASCAAGNVMVTMDPEGVLFPCGEANRGDRTNSVPRLGAAGALENLSLTNCGRCWSSRLVESEPASQPAFQHKLLPMAVPRPR